LDRFQDKQYMIFGAERHPSSRKEVDEERDLAEKFELEEVRQQPLLPTQTNWIRGKQFSQQYTFKGNGEFQQSEKWLACAGRRKLWEFKD